MTKGEFLNQLSGLLSSLPQEDVFKATNFYSEAISDRMEDGMTEEQAVFAMGTPESCAQSVLMDTPLPRLVAAHAVETRKKSGISPLVWVLLCIFLFPIWFPILMALIGITVAVYATLFSIIIGVAALVIGLGVACIALLAGGVVSLFYLPPMTAVCLVGVGLMLAGLTLILAIPCGYMVKLLALGVKKLGSAIKGLFIKKTA